MQKGKVWSSISKNLINTLKNKPMGQVIKGHSENTGDILNGTLIA